MAISQKEKYITFAIGCTLGCIFVGLLFKHKFESKQQRTLPPTPISLALEYQDTPTTKPDTFERVLILERPRYNDIIRIEETITTHPDGKEERLSRRITASDHIVVHIKPGVTQEELSKSLKIINAEIVVKRPSGELFEVRLNKHDLYAVPNAIEALLETGTIQRAVPLIIPE